MIQTYRIYPYNEASGSFRNFLKEKNFSFVDSYFYCDVKCTEEELIIIKIFHPNTEIYDITDGLANYENFRHYRS
jgi:hypothetical protein